MASKVPDGLDTVAKTFGYSVSIKLGYCSLSAIRTTSKKNLHLSRCQNTQSTCRCRHHPSKFPAKTAKGGPVRHAKFIQLSVASPRVGAVEVVAQQPQEEGECLRSRGSASEGARHLPK